MSSFNSWLIIVSLLFNVLLYRSSARPTYPPSGEFLHQVNLFYRYLKITECASFAVFPERQTHLTRCIINYILFGLDYAWHTPIWFRLRMAYTGKSNFTFPATRHFADIFSLIFFWQPKNYKSYSIVFKHLRKLWKCSCKFVFCRVWRVYAGTRNTWIAGPRVALRGKGKK